MDLGMGIAVGGGSISFASLAIGFFIWSLKRNVQNEDNAKAASDRKQETFDKSLSTSKEQHDKEMHALRSDMMNALHKYELDSRDSRTTLAGLAAALGELKGALSSLREAYDEGREKQAQFYRAELMKTEQTFRQELTRNLHPDLPERVGRLEALAGAKLKKKV